MLSALAEMKRQPSGEKNTEGGLKWTFTKQQQQQQKSQEYCARNVATVVPILTCSTQFISSTAGITPGSSFRPLMG